MVFTAVAIVAAVAVRPREWLGPRFQSCAPNAALAAGVAIVALTPVLLPYLLASRDQAGFSRSLDEVALSLGQADRLPRHRRHAALRVVEPAVLERRWAVPRRDGNRSHDCRPRQRRGDLGPARPYGRRVRLCRICAVVRAKVSGVHGGLSPLSGDGRPPGRRCASAKSRWPRSRSLQASASPHFTSGWRRAGRSPDLVRPAADRQCRSAPRAAALHGSGGIQPLFKSLNTSTPAVVVMFPFYPPSAIWLNARYMLESTAFWKPMLNGYSGFMPATYIERAFHLGGFPDETRSGSWRSLA